MATVHVPLTQGKCAVIDAEDWPLVSQFRWHAVRRPGDRWYAYAIRPHGTIRSKSIALHRFLLGDPPGLLVDHINRDGLDNRRENLRIATKVTNGANCLIRSHNTTGYKGVTFDKARGKWKAQITYNNANHPLGRFATPEDAARAYDRAARELFGEFAHTNFPAEG